VTPLLITGDQADLVIIAELLQDTQLSNPSGTARPGQQIRIQIHSTVPRQITYASNWGAPFGIPLATQTTGGDIDDVWTIQYDGRTGTWGLWDSTQLTRGLLPTGVTPGTYTCPTLTVNLQGQLTSVVSGTCPGGGGTTVAGLTGDVQLAGASGLTSDPGLFAHDVGGHITYTQGLQVGQGRGSFPLLDSGGRPGT